MVPSANALTIAFILVASVVFGALFKPTPALTKKQLIGGLRDLSRSTRSPDAAPPRVAVFFNGCVDLVTAALPVLDAAVPESEVSTPPGANVEVITTGSELVASFRDAFESGAACERVVRNGALFAKLRAAAEAVDAVETTGGNAALISNRLAIDGSSVLLGAPVGASLRKKLHSRVKPIYLGNAGGSDDIHLILEYAAGEVWTQRPAASKAPRANRFIVTEPAPSLDGEALGDFIAQARAFRPQLVVLSGIHLLEAMSDERREGELAKAEGAVAALRANDDGVVPMIHLELASLAGLDFMEAIGERMLRALRCESLGLNEQELAHAFVALRGNVSTLPTPAASGAKEGKLNPLKLVRSLKSGAQRLVAAARAKLGGGGGGGAEGAAAVEGAAEESRRGVYAARLNASEAGRLDALTSKLPNLDAVVAALLHVFDFAGTSLGRVHFHSLAYHVIAVRSSHEAQWPDAAAAAARGSVATTIQACGDEAAPDAVRALHGDDLELLYRPLSGATVRGVKLPPIDAASPVAEWTDTQSGVRFALAPVLVCKKPVRTVGLGDTISGAAMHRHLVGFA